MKLHCVLFMVLAILFGSCSNKTNSEKIEVSEKNYFFEAKADAVIVTDDTVTFTDFFGAEYTLKKGAYNNVVSLYHSHTALWYEAGGTVIGRVHTKGAESQLPVEAAGDDVEIVAIGITSNTISIEEVLKVNPDLILLGQAMGQPSLVAPFRSAGIDTIVVDYNDLSDYLKWYKVFSHLNNNGESYEKVAKQTLNNVTTILNKVPTSNNSTRVLAAFFAFGKISAHLSGTAIGNMLTQMGAVNIADDLTEGSANRQLNINIESLVLANPNIILIQSHDVKSTQGSLEDIYKDNKLWNELKAVKDGKVFYLDPNLFHYRPHSDYDKSYQTLFDILYSKE